MKSKTTEENWVYACEDHGVTIALRWIRNEPVARVETYGMNPLASQLQMTV